MWCDEECDTWCVMWWHRDHVWASRDQSVHNKMDLELSQLINLWVWVTDPQNGIIDKNIARKSPWKRKVWIVPSLEIWSREMRIVKLYHLGPQRGATCMHQAPGTGHSFLSYILPPDHTSHITLCNLLSELSPSSTGIRDHHRFLLPPPFGRRTFYSFCQYIWKYWLQYFKILERLNIYKIYWLKAYIRVLRRH